MREIILASGSAVRRHMLASAGVLFTVEPADVDEAAIRAELESAVVTVPPPAVAGVLARAKAEQVSARHPDALVIGADQVLALGTRLFEKPPTLDAARAQLSQLRGRRHALHSAVALAEGGRVVWETVGKAELTMLSFSDDFLDTYVSRAGERICASVGAYELEGLGLQLFEAIEGDYFTILGLPMLELLAELRNQGVLLS